MGKMITIVEFASGQYGFQYGSDTSELDKSELTIKKKVYIPDSLLKEIEESTLDRMDKILKGI